MNFQRLTSAIAAAAILSTGSISLSVMSAFSPLTQSVKAVSCNWSSSRPLPWNANVREAKTTAAARIGVKPAGTTLNFEAWENGQPIPDAWSGQPDSKWFKLRGERGWVASAVVPGYPPTNCTTPPKSLPSSTTEANKFFKMQFRDANYNPTGPSFSANCGPASLAMTLAALRREKPGLNIQESIDYASSTLMKRAKSNISTWAELQTGIRNAGGTPVNIDSWAALDQFLSQGKPVILNGYYRQNWRNQFPARTGDGDTAHLNAVLGKTSDGRYIVADPMHTGGTVAMNQSQLSVFFRLDGQNGNPWGIAVTGL